MATVSTEIASSPTLGRFRKHWLVQNAVALGYATAATAVTVGWLITRNYELVDPKYGTGYWFGIVGASLMGLLLLYPVRKRVRWMRYLGSTKNWFRMHMIFGVAGPVLILYHSNFTLGSLNSRVALISTLLVACSGLVGRYLFTKVHSDLDGHKTSLKELVDRARMSAEQKNRASMLVPDLLERMQRIDRQVLTPPSNLAAGLVLPLKLSLTTRIDRFLLGRFARRQLRAQTRRSPELAARHKMIESVTLKFIALHLRRVRRVAEFHSYERLFSLWHVFHLPFFYILVLTALVHVLAVHMY